MLRLEIGVCASSNQAETQGPLEKRLTAALDLCDGLYDPDKTNVLKYDDMRTYVCASGGGRVCVCACVVMWEGGEGGRGGGGGGAP